MQVKIASLRVKNGGALKDVKIDFTDTNGNPQPVTVLGGANGSGKTTVLELVFALSDFLKSSQDQFTSEHSPVINTLGIEIRNITSLNNIPNILTQTECAEMALLIDDKECNVFFGQCFTKEEILTNKHWSGYGILCENLDNPLIIRLSSKIGTQISKRIKQNEEKTQNIFSQMSESNLTDTMPSILYFPHNRELQPVKGEQIHREELNYQWCYRHETPTEFKGSLDSYLIWLDYAEPEFFKVVIDFMNQLDFEGKTFHINRKRLSAVLKTPDGNEHPLNQLSSGEQNILIMLLELQRRLVAGSIVLIDEIENSLHPAFQHRLAKNLLQLQQQIPFQLILTTHQPAFVTIFGEHCTRILTEF